MVFDGHTKIYDNFIFIGDFNVCIEENSVIHHCDINCIYVPTCFRNHAKVTCIDLILIKPPSLFQHSNAFETGLSDFHLSTVTKFKMGFQKLKPKITAFSDYKNFDNAKFRRTFVLVRLPSRYIWEIYWNQFEQKNYRNLCKKLLKNTKKFYFENLDIKELLITNVSGGLSYYLPKIHQKVKKLTSLMILNVIS